MLVQLADTPSFSHPVAASSPRSAPASDLRAQERALLERIRSGDRRAQRTFYERYHRRVRGHLFRLLASEADVDDALQTVFTRAFTGLATFKGESSLKTWLYRITVNTARNSMRHDFRQSRLKRAFHWFQQSRSQRHEDSPALIHDEAQRMLQQLKPKLREVFVLYHHEGLNLREIAEVVDRPISTVGDRLTRARRQLQAMVRA